MLYASKSEIAKQFKMSRTTVYRLLDGIEEEIRAGRYSRYAIADNKINKAVFLDYMTHARRLQKKNLRKTVPQFDIDEAKKYVLEYEEGAKAV